MTYIANALSLQMLRSYPCDLHIEEVTSLPTADFVSAVGHPDTAAVLGVQCNRINVALEKGDTLFVAQLQGGRLPEGSTTLPEGFSFRYLKVEIL